MIPVHTTSIADRAETPPVATEYENVIHKRELQRFVLPALEGLERYGSLGAFILVYISSAYILMTWEASVILTLSVPLAPAGVAGASVLSAATLKQRRSDHQDYLVREGIEPAIDFLDDQLPVSTITAALRGEAWAWNISNLGLPKLGGDKPWGWVKHHGPPIGEVADSLERTTSVWNDDLRRVVETVEARIHNLAENHELVFEDQRAPRFLVRGLLVHVDRRQRGEDEPPFGESLTLGVTRRVEWKRDDLGFDNRSLTESKFRSRGRAEEAFIHEIEELAVSDELADLVRTLRNGLEDVEEHSNRLDAELKHSASQGPPGRCPGCPWPWRLGAGT